MPQPHAIRALASRPRLLLLVAALVLNACTLAPPEQEERAAPAPVDPDFTRGIPEEQPLPPVRTEGLGEAEVQAVRVYRNSVRGVVNIRSHASWRHGLRGTQEAFGTGSGFIIDQNGHVVTNHHVIAGARQLIVTLYDGSHYPARVVGSDPELDLAVLRFPAQGRELVTLSPGDSDSLQVGQSVFALGNPFGLQGTFTSGVVSALNRPIQTESGFIIRDLIQSDAAINPGNSGGPLLDSGGDVIGINSMMIAPAAGNVGIGLAVPVNAAQRVVEEIVRAGRVERGWIDIEGIALDPQVAARGNTAADQGMLVTRVLPGSNAEAAGLRDGRGGRMIRVGPHRIPVEGDIIIALDGSRIGSVAELFAALAATRPDEEVTLTILRGGERRQMRLVLSDRPRVERDR